MKKTTVISFALALMITLSGCSERQNEESGAEFPNEATSSTAAEPQPEKIGHDAALIAALKHVSLTESQISRVKSRLERDDNGVYVYNIEFTSEGKLYEFDIDALSGEVARYVLDGENIGGNSSDEPNDQKYISEDDAKGIALKHAKLSESDVIFTEVKLNTENGASVYEVEFTKDGDKFDYTVDAVTGVIVDFSVNKTGEQSSSSAASSSAPESSSSSSASSSNPQSSKPASSSKPQSSSKPASSSKPQSSSKPASSSKPQSSSKPVSSSTPTAKNITEAQAKDIAVKHAKLLANNVTFKEVKMKTEKGIQVYDIKFVTGDTEYEYTIEAAAGDIIEYSSEKIGTTSELQSGSKISEWEAKNIAIVHAGTSVFASTFDEVKLELENGVWVYEIKFVSKDTEFEYKINAVTGDIIEHSSEKVTASQPASTQITVDQAKEAALKHAGVAADKASFTEAKLDGSKYEIEFTADGFEYDYEISAADGAVIK